MAYLTNRKFGDPQTAGLTVTEIDETYTINATTTSGTCLVTRSATANFNLTLPENPTAGFHILYFHAQEGRTVNVVTSGSDTFIGGTTKYATSDKGVGAWFWYVGGNLWGRYTADNPWTIS